jgi:NADH-quinone oxidoreductase subunit N
MTLQAYHLEFFIAISAIGMLLAEAFIVPKGSKAVLATFGIFIMLTSLVLLNTTFSVPTFYSSEHWMGRFYQHDVRAIVFKNIILFSSLLVFFLALDYRAILGKYTSDDNSDENSGEFYYLLVFACSGMMWMASATDFVSIFVSLELVTICFYVMVAYMRRNVGSLEAGVKYLILGALSTGILVYGIAWIYGSYGSTHLPSIAARVTSQPGGLLELPLPALFGLTMVIIALAFKVGAIPMQLWIPDVYQGAPTPVTAFLSVASKSAGFAIAISILEPFVQFEKVRNILLILAAATLLYGSLSALKQHNFKRLLAYSSVVHAGFILIALAYGKFDLVVFYLITYMIMTFGAFFVLNSIRVEKNSDEIAAFDGLAKRNPSIALIMSIIMAAMAGLPLTAGFYGKFLVLKAMFESMPNSLLVAAFCISVASGFYFYLKVIKAMYWQSSADESPIPFSSSAKISLLTITFLLLILGIYPQPLFNLFNL